MIQVLCGYHGMDTLSLMACLLLSAFQSSSHCTVTLISSSFSVSIKTPCSKTSLYWTCDAGVTVSRNSTKYPLIRLINHRWKSCECKFWQLLGDHLAIFLAFVQTENFLSPMVLIFVISLILHPLQICRVLITCIYTVYANDHINCDDSVQPCVCAFHVLHMLCRCTVSYM